MVNPRPSLVNRRRLEVRLDIADLPRIDAFLQKVAHGMGWDAAATRRLRSAGEETLASLLQPGDRRQVGGTARLVVVARPSGEAVEMELLAGLHEENLEDPLAYLDEQTETSDEGELSFRLLRHYASSVRHQQYQGLDVVTVRVKRNAGQVRAVSSINSRMIATHSSGCSNCRRCVASGRKS